jgi:hypothetical protein
VTHVGVHPTAAPKGTPRLDHARGSILGEEQLRAGHLHQARDRASDCAACSHADAIRELERCAGTQFDPDVVAPLIEVLSARFGWRQ